MNVKFLNPFVDAASEVLQKEAKVVFSRGDLGLEKSAYVSDDVTVISALVGMVVGNVFYSMNSQTAISLASRILGESLSNLDNLAQSGIAELSNVITGRASVKLAATGYESTISPPTMLLGKGATITTLDYPRLIVPLTSEIGNIHIHLALREKALPTFSTAQQPVADKPKI